MATFNGITLENWPNKLVDISAQRTPNISRPFGVALYNQGVKMPLISSGSYSPQDPRSIVTNRAGKSIIDYYDLFYDHILIDKNVIDVGNITEPVSYKFLVANMFATEQTVTVQRYNYEGIVDDAGDSFVLPAITDREITITIGVSGSPSFDATIVFVSGNEQVVLQIIGSRGLIWPFMFNEGWSETWEWETHILKFWDFNEERTPLRKEPRRFYKGTYSTRDEGSTYMDLLVMGQGFLPFGVPLFEQAVIIQAPNAGATTISFTQPGSVFIAGQKGILWKDDIHYESFVIESVGTNQLTIKKPLIRSLGGEVLLAPVLDCRIQDTMNRTDYGKRASDMEVEWLVDTPFPYQPAQTLGPDFGGYPIFEIPIWVKNKQLQRTFSAPKITLDNGLAEIRYLHIQTYEQAGQSILIPCHSLEEIILMRGRICYLMGNVTPFWLATGRHDLTIAQDYDPGGSLIINFCHYSAYGKTKRKYLRIELVDGTVYYRTVVSSVVGMNGDTEEVNIDSNLSSKIIPKENFYKISFLSLVRMSSDSVKWEWKRTNQKVDITFSITEVLA